MPWDRDLDPKSPAYGIASSQTRFNRVVAGPGTGKSFALKRRVARLLEQGADPERILPVTFTNVAAEDLQREMLQIGVPGCENIRGSTLHSLCMRILSRQSVLDAPGRIPRPLNKFEIEPLLYDYQRTSETSVGGTSVYALTRQHGQGCNMKRPDTLKIPTMLPLRTRLSLGSPSMREC
jgi:UvrD/REP helicase N-terminal domain